jgi:hypothetical protein
LKKAKGLVLAKLQVNVTVNYGRAIVRCALPTNPVEFDLEGEKLTFIHSML